MKKITIVVLAIIALASCEKVTELNENVKNPNDVPADALIANAIKELSDLLTSTNVNENPLRLWSQHRTQTTYTDESNFELVERDINGQIYGVLYAYVLRDLKEAELAINQDPFITEEQKSNQLAILEILRVYTYHVLVDLFADIPYNEALESTTPEYDDDQAIYTDLFERLEAAVGNLGGDVGLGGSDLLYGGNAEAWARFANSLQLRMAIRLRDVNPSKSQQEAEEAVSRGVISSPTGTARIAYQTAPPNTNPLWEDLVQSGRTDFIASATFTDILNELDDPRRRYYFKNTYSYDSTYFDPAENDSVTIEVETDSLLGAPHGTPSSYPSFSQPGIILESTTLPGVLMSYVETAFNLADAAQLGYNVGGNAEDFYEDAIEASILKWEDLSNNYGDEVSLDPNAVSDYLAQPEVSWNASNAEELIGTQKWIAMYNRPFEAYSTWRLYDSPELAVAAGAGTITPHRLTYPVEEYTLNQTNVTGANEGTDDPFYQVFWDVQEQ